MELKILSTDNSEKGSQKLPGQFQEAMRPDVISRAVFALQANARQPYGASPGAGKRHSVELSRRRHNYRGAYGFGISRVPRKIHTRRGTRMYWVAAEAPGTVGGRRAHPPKPSKDYSLKINKMENRLAIRSSISATIIKSLVTEHGYNVPKNYPFIIDNSFEALSKTKDVKQALIKLGFEQELKRADKKTVRAGRGKLRGRKYKKKTSLLFVVSKDCELLKGAKNIAGIDVAIVNALNAELLAPGAKSGRAALFTKSAVDRLEKEKLYTEAYKGKIVKKEEKKTER